MNKKTEKEFWENFSKTQLNSSNRLEKYERIAINLLGELKGKTVLDCGIGVGRSTLFLSQQDAVVIGFDISFSLLKRVKKKLLPITKGKSRVVEMEGERMGFKAEKFDKVLGIYFLHHTTLQQAVAEIERVMKKGGRGVFVENFGFNLLLNFFRKYVTGKWGVKKYGSPSEHPLTFKDLKLLKSYFKKVDLIVPDFLFFRLLSRQVFQFKYKPINWVCSILDKWIYKGFKSLKHYSYTQIILVEK